VLNTP